MKWKKSRFIERTEDWFHCRNYAIIVFNIEHFNKREQIKSNFLSANSDLPSLFTSTSQL